MPELRSGDAKFGRTSAQAKAESGDDSLRDAPPQVEKIYCRTDWRAVPDVWKKMWRPRTGPSGEGLGETPCGPWEAVERPEKERGFIFASSWEEWRTCYWCWRWGLDMTIPAAVEQPLCNECIQRDEPPWYPNDRKRCQHWIEYVFSSRTSRKLGEGASKTIASFIASPVVP